MIINYRAPILGKHEDISLTPDDTFSSYMVGPGFVIFPEDNQLFSPIDGVISHVFSSKHVIAIKHESGIQVLIHLGLGSVELQGKGITSYVELNQRVNQGDLIMSFEYDYFKDHIKSLAIPIVFVQKASLKVNKIIKKEQYLNMILEVE